MALLELFAIGARKPQTLAKQQAPATPKPVIAAPDYKTKPPSISTRAGLKVAIKTLGGNVSHITQIPKEARLGTAAPKQSRW